MSPSSRRSPLVILVIAVLAACSSPGTSPSEAAEPSDAATGSPSAVASAPASAEPSVGASAAATSVASEAPSAPASAGLTVDGLATVIVTDLVVRSAPGVDPATSTILADRLTTDDRLFVVDGPVDADGYGWYLVAPLERADGTVGPFGWIAAASRDGEPWVTATAATCPATVTLRAVLDLHPYERLACFGDGTITLDGPVVTCGVADGPYLPEPAWLHGLSGCGLAPDTSGQEVLLLRAAPDGPGGPSTGPVRVTGHFDDPASSTCTMSTVDPVEFPVPPIEQVILDCRTEFVVESSS